jgi:integrase
MFFDARAAKGLSPGNHIVVHGCPGLRLVAKETRKTWIYRFRSPVDKALRQIKIGGWPAMPPAEAVARWNELREKRDAGLDPVREKERERAQAVAPVAAGYTLGHLAEDYITGYLYSNRQERGARAVGQRLRNAIAPHAAMLATDTSRRLVFSLIESLLDRPILAKSVKTEMAAAWRYASEAGRIPEDLPNWFAEKSSHKFRSKGALRDGERKGTAKRVLAGNELRTLLRDDLNLFSTQVQRFLTIQLWTCTRGAEICQMRRNQITDEDGALWWTVPKQYTKGRNIENAFDLRVPLEGRAKQIVLELLASTPADIPWLFASKSKSGVVQGQTQAYMQSKVHYMQPYSKAREDHIRKRMTVTHWSPHDLRRTGRTMLAAMGCPREIGEAILGHVLPGVEGDYNLYQYDAERRMWLKRLSDRLEQLAA